MFALHGPLAAASALGMVGHDRTRMTDDHPPADHHHLNGLPDQAPRHRVAVGIEVDRAVTAHLAHQVAKLSERRAATKRAQRGHLVGEPLQRRLAGRPVNAHVGDFPVPLVEVGNEGTPAGEAPAGHCIVLH
jgi:Arc/MetJ family transcription regulator